VISRTVVVKGGDWDTFIFLEQFYFPHPPLPPPKTQMIKKKKKKNDLKK